MLEFTLHIRQADRAELAKDPELYLRKALEKAGQKVNDVILGKEARENLLTKPVGPQPEDGPVVGAIAHIESPPQHASKHIAIVITA